MAGQLDLFTQDAAPAKCGFCGLAGHGKKNPFYPTGDPALWGKQYVIVCQPTRRDVAKGITARPAH
jgi:hypothetical protein